MNKFANHLAAAGSPRQFRRILPENDNSPLGSSPAFGAQAEAFIAADQQISPTRRARTATLLKTPSRRPKSRMSDGTIFGDAQNNPWHAKSKFAHGQSVYDDLAGFNMAEAVGEASSFLQNWSVDTELQKSKEVQSTSRPESAGLRRGKLCGLA